MYICLHVCVCMCLYVYACMCACMCVQGSIFAEFDRVEDAEQFVKKDIIQFNGTDLLRECLK